MKSICINKHGSVDVLKVVENDEPICPSNKLKINIKACSLNHLDIWVRNGIPGFNIPLPLILGSDASGVVIEVGQKINDYSIGDNVIIQPGTFDKNCNIVKKGKENYSNSYGILGETQDGVQTEYILLDPINIYKKPNHLSFEEAACMPLVFMTAYQMLIERALLLPEEIVLIYGGTSGVGMAAIQIAKDIGAKVITTVGSSNKKKFVENLGADYILDHNDKGLAKKIKDISSKGIDVIFEHIGDLTWKQSLKVLGIGGRIITCGATTGSSVKIDLKHLFIKQQTIMGSTKGRLGTFKNVVEKINNKNYIPFIDDVYKFHNIKNAHLRMENREHFGKIVLIP